MRYCNSTSLENQTGIESLSPKVEAPTQYRYPAFLSTLCFNTTGVPTNPKRSLILLTRYR